MPVHHSCFKNPFEENFQDVIWKDGFPYSNAYQDRFFQDDAVAEITNIFIEPNQLLERIKNGSRIRIGELGFGFGLNFLVTAKFWFENNKNFNFHNLEYLAIDEALPTKAQILKIIKSFPELDEICHIFLKSYNLSHNDMQRIYFPSLKIRLTLVQNDVESGLKNLLGLENNQIDNSKLKKSIEFSGLSNYIQGLPNDINTSVGEAGAKISGGQRQRIGLARAMYKDSKILILDEATSALDTKTEDLVLNSIFKNKDRTIIIISHKLSSLRFCDEVYELKNGRLISKVS